MGVSVFGEQSFETYGKKVGVGFAVQIVSDMLFLYFAKRLYAPIIHEPKKARIVVAALTYAIMASVVAASFQAKTIWSAMGVGALVGAWVSAGFDLSIVGARGDYPIWAAVTDVAYGSLITSLLFAAQHAVS